MSETRYARQKRDQKTADGDGGYDPSLMCAAVGCPNRWFVDLGSGRTCSAHAWSDRHLWPQITQEQLDGETDRALADAAKIGQPPKQRMTRAEKLAILDKVRSITMGSPNSDPRAWARKLRDRERSGERLTIIQKSAWREALNTPALSSEFAEMQP